VIEMPLEKECRALMTDARRGKNMFVLGMLCSIYSFDLQLARDQVALTFGKKDRAVIETNVKLLEAGFAWGEANLDFKYVIPAKKVTIPQVVTNGNTAIALGVLASGMDICAMYPITPATSASHYLSTASRRWAAWSTRPRTRSRPAPSRSAPPTPAGARSPSPPARATRSSRRASAWRSWQRSRWWS